jgi:hypothetical protein
VVEQETMTSPSRWPTVETRQDQGWRRLLRFTACYEPLWLVHRLVAFLGYITLVLLALGVWDLVKLQVPLPQVN